MKTIYFIENACVKDNNGEFLSADKLVWKKMVNNIFESYDQANVTRIILQQNDNNSYYRVAN